MTVRDKNGREVDVVIDDEMRAVSGHYTDDGTELTKRELREVDYFCEDQIYPKWLARQAPGQRKPGPSGPIK